MPVASYGKMKRNASSFQKLFPGVSNIAVESFGTGEVAKLLGIPIWRLQKFIDSPQYQFSPEGKLGKGLGSRRVFSQEDIYRIALAARLVEDGFAAKFVGSILEQFDDYDFNESHDERGKALPPPGLVGLVRGTDGPKLRFFGNKRPPKLGGEDSPYYLLNLHEVKGEINKRIARMKK